MGEFPVDRVAFIAAPESAEQCRKVPGARSQDKSARTKTGAKRQEKAGGALARGEEQERKKDRSSCAPRGHLPCIRSGVEDALSLFGAISLGHVTHDTLTPAFEVAGEGHLACRGRPRPTSTRLRRANLDRLGHYRPPGIPPMGGIWGIGPWGPPAANIPAPTPGGIPPGGGIGAPGVGRSWARAA